MSVEKDESEAGGKKTSASYPYLPLNLSLKVADAVRELGGVRTEVSKSVLASHLKETEKSAVFQQRLAAAKAFGLIEGFGAYRLTELAKRFYFPTNDTDKARALLEMLATPESFKGVIRRFDGSRMPSREILANIFHREFRVPDSWKDRAAAYFTSSAELAKALDEHGFLRYSAHMQRAQSQVDSSAVEIEEPSRSSHEMPVASGTQVTEMARFPRKPEPASPGNKVFVWPYKGSYIRLETPEDMPRSLWEKLRGYVELLKPEVDPEADN